jgi:hypothetical protein
MPSLVYAVSDQGGPDQGAQPRRGRGGQVGGGQRGQGQPGLDHLRLERQPDPDAGQQQLPQRPATAATTAMASSAARAQAG